MRLEIDVGNTLLKWRLVNGAAQAVQRVPVATLSEADFVSLADQPVTEVLVASVAGAQVRGLLDAVAMGYWGVVPRYAQTAAECSGVKNSYQDPSRMGVDRWLAMVAAYQQTQAAVMVVSCGSAITVDYLDALGVHQGGYILPGIYMMRRALVQDTARVRFDEQLDNITAEPGKSTAEAVEHGTYFVVRALAAQLAKDAHVRGAQLIFTGGDGALMHGYAGCGVYRSTLVMDGLQWVCQRA